MKRYVKNADDWSYENVLNKRKLAKGTNIEKLWDLAKDPDYSVRLCVAENPNTPVEILEELAHDKAYIVRLRVAENPNASSDILNYLSDDRDSSVLRGVLTNPNCPESVILNFENLIEKFDDTLQLYLCIDLAEDINTPYEILTILAENANSILSQHGDDVSKMANNTLNRL